MPPSVPGVVPHAGHLLAEVQEMPAGARSVLAVPSSVPVVAAFPVVHAVSLVWVTVAVLVLRSVVVAVLGCVALVGAAAHHLQHLHHGVLLGRAHPCVPCRPRIQSKVNSRRCGEYPDETHCWDWRYPRQVDDLSMNSESTGRTLAPCWRPVKGTFDRTPHARADFGMTFNVPLEAAASWFRHTP